MHLNIIKTFAVVVAFLATVAVSAAPTEEKTFHCELKWGEPIVFPVFPHGSPDTPVVAAENNVFFLAGPVVRSGVVTSAGKYSVDVEGYVGGGPSPSSQVPQCKILEIPRVGSREGEEFWILPSVLLQGDATMDGQLLDVRISTETESWTTRIMYHQVQPATPTLSYSCGSGGRSVTFRYSTPNAVKYYPRFDVYPQYYPNLHFQEWNGETETEKTVAIQPGVDYQFWVHAGNGGSSWVTDIGPPAKVLFGCPPLRG